METDWPPTELRRRVRCAAAFWLLGIVFGGCFSEPSADPAPSPAQAELGSAGATANSQPAQRIAQIASIQDWRDEASFEIVLAGLNDADEAVRQAAYRQVEGLVGSAVPYRSSWPAERRAAAIRAYRRLSALARKHDQQDLIDLVPMLLEQVEVGTAAQRQQTIDDIVLLTGVTYGLRSDDPPELQATRIGLYRNVWKHWNRPGSKVLASKRHSRTAAQPLGYSK